MNICCAQQSILLSCYCSAIVLLLFTCYFAAVLLLSCCFPAVVLPLSCCPAAVLLFLVESVWLVLAGESAGVSDGDKVAVWLGVCQ